jgi:hypothetical protein
MYRDKQEEVFMSIYVFAREKTLSCLYPMAKVKSIIFAMLPEVRATNIIMLPYLPRR